MNTDTNRGLAIPDSEYDRIIDILKHKRKVVLRNKQNVPKKFYMKNGTLYADSWDGFVRHTEEVFKLSTVAAQQASNQFRDGVKERMAKDHPEWSADLIEANADIITEANETIKRLIANGVDTAVAVGVVKHVLATEDITPEFEELKRSLASTT